MTTSHSDALDLLLIATSRGDRAEFAQLYERAAPTLFAICLRLLRRRDWAEDALQEAFLRIWHKAHLYEPTKGAALPWMIVLARRCAFDRLRQYEDATLETFDEAESADAPDVALNDTEYDLRRCLDELANEPRRAILLAYVWGLSHGELAQRLTTPLGTVKSWIRRGLMSLKECLDQ